MTKDINDLPFQQIILDEIAGAGLSKSDGKVKMSWDDAKLVAKRSTERIINILINNSIDDDSGYEVVPDTFGWGNKSSFEVDDYGNYVKYRKDNEGDVSCWQYISFEGPCPWMSYEQLIKHFPWMKDKIPVIRIRRVR